MRWTLAHPFCAKPLTSEPPPPPLQLCTTYEAPEEPQLRFIASSADQGNGAAVVVTTSAAEALRAMPTHDLPQLAAAIAACTHSGAEAALSAAASGDSRLTLIAASREEDLGAACYFGLRWASLGGRNWAVG